MWKLIPLSDALKKTGKPWEIFPFREVGRWVFPTENVFFVVPLFPPGIGKFPHFPVFSLFQPAVILVKKFDLEHDLCVQYRFFLYGGELVEWRSLELSHYRPLHCHKIPQGSLKSHSRVTGLKDCSGVLSVTTVVTYQLEIICGSGPKKLS